MCNVIPATTFVDCSSKTTLLLGVQVGVSARKAGWVCNSAKAPLHLQCECTWSKPGEHAGVGAITGIATRSGRMTGAGGGTVGTSCAPSPHRKKGFGFEPAVKYQQEARVFQRAVFSTARLSANWDTYHK